MVRARLQVLIVLLAGMLSGGIAPGVLAGDGQQRIFNPQRNAANNLQGGAPQEPASGSSSLAMMLQALFFISVLGAGAYLFVQYKRKPNVASRASGRSVEGLRVMETRMLGNKQFLVVVDYSGQRMLLGVGPGLIRHLCELPTPEETFIEEAAEDKGLDLYSDPSVFSAITSGLRSHSDKG